MSDENKRIEIDDLPRAAEVLTAEEEKGVTGGVGATSPGGVNIALADGSVRNTSPTVDLETNKLKAQG